MNPKLQSLLAELEQGLGSVMRKQTSDFSHGRGDADESLSGKKF